jgi:phage replication-related protein YjqB (UPF0714/DUF867 family)
VNLRRDEIGFGDLLRRPGVTEVCELGSTFGFLAFHGGNLERRTDEIASEAAARSGSSFYGVIQPAGLRHHIASVRVDPAHSPRLAAFLDHCRVVVAVHGYGRHGRWTQLLVGGGNRDLAAHVAGHLRRALPAYQVVDDLARIPAGLRGLHPSNPCNRTRAGGVQLELPPRVRGLTPMARWWPGSPARLPHVEDLVGALAAAASAWMAGAGGEEGASAVSPRPHAAPPGTSPWGWPAPASGPASTTSR